MRLYLKRYIIKDLMIVCKFNIKKIKYGENVICKYAYYNDYHVVAIYTEDEKNLHAIVKLK